MSLDINVFPLGPLETNCYLVRCADEAWVIDPSMWPGPLLNFLGSEGVTVTAVLLTHGHGDHIAGVDDVLAAHPGARLLCPAAETHMLVDVQANLSASLGFPIRVAAACEAVDPGDELTLGGSAWRVLDTAGHTVGGASYYCAAEAVVFTGDALFAGGVGRTDIPGGDWEQLLGAIRENLLTLPDETRALPGHGPATTIGRERAGNPYLTRA